MNKRYDVTAPREYTDRDGNKKTNWINLGVAFEKDGRISILLNALPMPGQDGQAKLILMEPKQDSGSSGGNRTQGNQSRGNSGGGFAGGFGGSDDLSDDVPF